MSETTAIRRAQHPPRPYTANWSIQRSFRLLDPDGLGPLGLHSTEKEQFQLLASRLATERILTFHF